MGHFWDDPRTIAKADGATGKENDLRLPMHLYEVRPRKDKRGVDLISDVLPFGRLMVRSLWQIHGTQRQLFCTAV